MVPQKRYDKKFHKKSTLKLVKLRMLVDAPFVFSELLMQHARKEELHRKHVCVLPIKDFSCILAQLCLYPKDPTYAHGEVTVLFDHMPERCDSAGILFALRPMLMELRIPRLVGSDA